MEITEEYRKFIAEIRANSWLRGKNCHSMTFDAYLESLANRMDQAHKETLEQAREGWVELPKDSNGKILNAGEGSIETPHGKTQTWSLEYDYGVWFVRARIETLEDSEDYFPLAQNCTLIEPDSLEKIEADAEMQPLTYMQKSGQTYDPLDGVQNRHQMIKDLIRRTRAVCEGESHE